MDDAIRDAMRDHGPPYATAGALERVETRVRDDRVTLQKQIEREIAYVRELIDQRIALQEAARELHAVEIARRLDELNHNHARAEEALAKTVPREVFEDYKSSMSEALEIARKEQQLWKDTVNQAITQSQTSSKTWMVAIGLLVTLISLVLRFVGPN